MTETSITIALDDIERAITDLNEEVRKVEPEDAQSTFDSIGGIISQLEEARYIVEGEIPEEDEDE